MKYLLDVREMKYAMNQVDQEVAVLEHPGAMKEAFRLGQQPVTRGRALPSEPLDVELF